MILFFNLQKVESLAGSDPLKWIKLIEEIFYKKQLKTKLNPKNLSLAGTSFILNPSPLFLNDIPAIYVAQYIKLAGKRDYFTYKHYQIASLDLTLFPDINLEVVKHNPLLQIQNTQIFFKYEELYNGFKVQRYQRQGSKEVS